VVKIPKLLSLTTKEAGNDDTKKGRAKINIYGGRRIGLGGDYPSWEEGSIGPTWPKIAVGASPRGPTKTTPPRGM